MRVIFDQGVPLPLRRLLTKHTVSTAFELGWMALDNGALLAAAEAQFDALVTTDQNLRYQQNLARTNIGDTGTADHQLAKDSRLTATRSQPHSTHCVRAISWN